MKTSYYANLKKIDTSKFVPIAISGDEGKLINFNGSTCRSLSPYTFFKKWKEMENEIDQMYKSRKISRCVYESYKAQNQNYYVEKFYEKVLKPLDPKKVYNDLGENAVLLCFEKPTDFCHRFLVAGWLELSLGVTVDELGFENDKQVQQNRQSLKNAIQTQMEKDKTKEH